MSELVSDASLDLSEVFGIELWYAGRTAHSVVVAEGEKYLVAGTSDIDWVLKADILQKWSLIPLDSVLSPSWSYPAVPAPVAAACPVP